ncbi:MAG: hypothetical protein GXN99_02370 [Candidatus Nanohaloarchaeota archaeon]|nr:hypothetical protein [Candidatus Nanohaloarchaeota archaeon]
MNYKRVDTCSSIIFHLSKGIDVEEFSNILIKERSYKKTGTIGTNIELSKDDVYMIVGKKTIVVEGDNENEIAAIESLIKDL